MAPRSRNVIILQGDYHEEHAVADGILTPGMLVQPGSSPTGWEAHSNEGGPAIMAFVRENREVGTAGDFGHGIDTAIAVGDACTVVFPNMGARVFALVEGTVSRGDQLESNGAGKLQLQGSGACIAVAATDTDNAVPLRCEVYVGATGGNE